MAAHIRRANSRSLTAETAHIQNSAHVQLRLLRFPPAKAGECKHSQLSVNRTTRLFGGRLCKATSTVFLRGHLPGLYSTDRSLLCILPGATSAFRPQVIGLMSGLCAASIPRFQALTPLSQGFAQFMPFHKKGDRSAPPLRAETLQGDASQSASVHRLQASPKRDPSLTHQQVPPSSASSRPRPLQHRLGGTRLHSPPRFHDRGRFDTGSGGTNDTNTSSQHLHLHQAPLTLATALASSDFGRLTLRQVHPRGSAPTHRGGCLLLRSAAQPLGEQSSTRTNPGEKADWYPAFLAGQSNLRCLFVSC